MSIGESHSEVSADLMMEAMLPLRALTQRGLSTLLTHHPAKGEPLAGQAARGTGALTSFTDINLEMSWYHKNDIADRRRRILSQSRFEETPRQLVCLRASRSSPMNSKPSLAPWCAHV